MFLLFNNERRRREQCAARLPAQTTRERERERERETTQTCRVDKKYWRNVSAIFPSFSKGVGKQFRSNFDSTHPLLFHFDSPKNYMRLKRFNQEASSSISEYTLQSRHTIPLLHLPSSPLQLCAVFLWERSMCLCFFSVGEEASEKASGRPFPSRSFGGGFCPLPPCKRRRIFASEDVIFSKNLSNNERL